jgi:hypothetical protein
MHMVVSRFSGLKLSPKDICIVADDGQDLGRSPQHLGGSYLSPRSCD